MAVKYNSNRDLSVVPKLPTYNPYNRQQPTDPSAYYTKALGLLPIDTRYLVNTTNRLAYNSMADVLFNAEAWDKRWENSDHSWLSKWYGYIPRVIADTALLIKDTQVDPIVQGITEDGWNGFLRGGSTALMNTLVNVGNTLDIVSNPIKGAVIEGFTSGGKNAWEGFTTGLFGDSQGRKQYDYSDYINTGNGALDIILSWGLETVFDPINWISFGSKSAVKIGSDKIADTVTKNIKSTLDDALDQGFKSVNDIAPKLVQSSKYFTDDTAKAFLNVIADKSGNITKSAVDEFTNNLQPLLKKAITNAELAGGGTKGYRKVIKDLAQSKGSRYKASLFSRVNMPPSTQMFVSNYLANASKNMPDLLAAGGKYLRYGSRAYKTANNAENVLRWIAGSTGLGEAVGLYKAGSKLKGWIGNVRAVRDPNVIKTLDDLYGILGQPENLETVLETIKAVDDAAINDDFIKKLTPAINKYFNNLQGQSFLKKDLSKLTQLQTNTLTEINDLVKGLNIDGVKNITDYIKYLSNNNAFTKNQAVSDFIKQLQTVNTELSKNFSDDKVRALYRKTIKHQGAVIDKVAKTMRTQGEQIDKIRKLYAEFKRKYNVPELSKQLTELDTEYDRVIENTIGKSTDTFSFEDSLEDIVIRAEQALRDAGNASYAEWLHSNWLEFKGYVKDYTVNKTDLDVKRRLVESYQDLDNKLKSNLRFPEDEELNITSASEIKNKYGMSALGGRGDTPTVTPAAKKIADITPEEKILLEKEKSILEALNEDATYKKYVSDIKQFAAENPDIDDIDGMLYEYIRDTYKRNNSLAGMRGAEAVNILKQAEDLRTLKPNADLILDNAPITLSAEAAERIIKEASVYEARLADDVEYQNLINEYNRLKKLKFKDPAYKDVYSVAEDDVGKSSIELLERRIAKTSDPVEKAQLIELADVYKVFKQNAPVFTDEQYFVLNKYALTHPNTAFANTWDWYVSVSDELAEYKASGVIELDYENYLNSLMSDLLVEADKAITNAVSLNSNIKIINNIEILESKINRYVAETYGFKASYTLQQADILKKIGQGDVPAVYKNASLQELADAIKDLPSFNEVKRLDQYINPADIKKYKLIVYGIMNRQASIYNQLLGLDGAITKIGERITPVYNKTIFKDANIGVALTYLKENGRLPNEFTYQTSKAGVEGIVSAEAKARFVNNLRIEATALYERIALHHTMSYYFYGYGWTELDAYAKIDTAFKEVWDLYNETLDNVAAHKLNPLTDDVTIVDALNEIAERVQTKLDALPDNIIPVKAVNDSLLLEQQAKTLMQMSNEDILSLVSFKKVDLFDKSPAYLKNLLDMYDDTTSVVYKILNDPVLLENESYKSTLEAAKEFFKRAKAYANTVDAIKVRAETMGLDEFYLEAILDSFVSQLRNLDNMSDYKLDTIVDNIIKDANVFLRNRFDTPSFAMDRVLRQVSNKRYRGEHAIFAKNIKARLDKGLAHGAVADVDNWIDLAYLSKYSKDPRIAGMYDSLLKEADGKHIVVFDIESTGADETASHIFQISGRVLTPDGVDTGIKFNYIIPPPEGIKPTPLVLETLAPIGEDPEVWWQTAIVNAKTTDTQFVCKSVDEALQRIMSDCSTVGPMMLAGHNIKAYDIPALVKNVHSSETLKTYFSTAKVFDSLSYMNTQTVFQLVGEEENIFKQQLKYILSDAIYSETAALKGVPFTGFDVNTLSELKQILKDNPQVSSKYFVNGKVVSEAEALKNAGFEGNTFGHIQDFGLDIFEQNLNGIINEWRTPAKVKGSGYFIVSKLNPDDLTEQMDAYFKELTKLGLVSGRNTMVVPGKNIMNIMTSNVQRGTILINPVKVLSYEVENIFDLNKALNIYKTVDRANEMRFQDLARLTRIAKGVQKLRIFIPEDFIKEVKDTAISFLKQAEEELPYLKCLHDNADDLTVVATAVYAYGRLNSKSPLRAIDDFKKLNYSNTMATLRQQTPILHNIDKNTGLPKAVFIDDAYSYDTVTKFMKEDLRLESIKDYNIDKNLYNIHSAAKHAALEPVFELAKKIDNYYKSLGDNGVEAVRAVKHYNDALDAVAIKEILSSTPEELKATMYMRGGYIVFETNETISLNKFMDDNDLFVLDNVSTGDHYIHFICSKRGTLTASNDMDTIVKVVTDVEGINKEAIGLIEELRIMSSKSGLKNLYLSHGDTITEDTIDIIHNALVRAGVPEATIKQLVSVDDLKAMGFFDSVRANNSVIGNKTLWSYLTDDPDYYYITDPYKQLVYTMDDVSKRRDQITLYCSLLLNKHSSINAAKLFEKLTDEELYTLLKKDEHMCLVYLTKSHYLDHTKSGIIAKEFDVINAASITRAKKMGGVHIMPRTQAAQLMQDVNEFELPPIARIVKAISDVYKVAYLGSLGFIVRNLIDSNYKTYTSLNGQVSLPKSIKHFFQSMHFVRKHTRIGQEYSKAMGEIFKSDLEYEVFYKYCKNFGKDNIVDVIAEDYSKQLRRRVVRQVEKLSQNFNDATLIKELQSDLIDPPMFSIIDSFINHGPSAGLSKTILSNLPSKQPQKTIDGVADAVEQGLNNFNKVFTDKLPTKYIYGFNDTIEQAARLSMFLQRLELGDTVDGAIKGVIKAHFDYSDKTIGMLYTEMIFPFMSFSYKNLNFWIDMMSKNPMLVGQLENIFRPLLNYNSLFEPDQEAYEDYDYTFDWSKDVRSFQSNMPWTYINAARLYHILNGNIVIDRNKTVKHDSGYDEKDNELYTVFKLSPSVLDAVKMLYTPLNAYSERMLPPYETMLNIFLGMADDKNVVEEMNIAALANKLPYADTIMQRVGLDQNGLRHNNIFKRIKDNGAHQLIGSLFGTVYVPQKDDVYYYDSDYNILGGFKQNYYAKKIYSNPYNSKYPSYTLTRMAQNKKPRNIYARSKTNRAYNQQYNSIIRGTTSRILRNRIKDYNYYY